VIAPTGSRDVPHFNRNEPDRIYAYSPVEGLVSFRWDGTDVRQHLQVRGGPAVGGALLNDEPLMALPRRVFPFRLDAPGLVDEPLEQAPQAPPAGLVMISPTGGRALAQIGMQIYTVDIPEVGGPAPTISVANPAGAPVPVRQLTDVGGEFPAWSADGKRVHYAIGNAFFTYDLERVQFIEDSVRAAERARADSARMVRTMLDSLKAVRARVDSLQKAGAEVPDSLRARLNALRADSIRIRADSLLARADSLRARADSIRARADSVRAGQDPASARADRSEGYKPDEIRIRVTLPRDVPRGTVVLRGGRAVTMKGHEIIENADVVVTDNRIVAVGPRGEVEIPPDARII